MTGGQGGRTGARPASSAAWSARPGETWLRVNESSVSAVWTKSDPGLLLAAVPDLPGYVRDGSPDVSTIADPGASDTLAGMTIVIPDMFGRDLADAEILRRDDEVWLRIVSTVYRPAWTVPALSIGASVFTIGPEGYTKWRTLPTAD